MTTIDSIRVAGRTRSAVLAAVIAAPVVGDVVGS